MQLLGPWALIDGIEKDGRWTIAELEQVGARLADVPFALGNPFAS